MQPAEDVVEPCRHNGGHHSRRTHEPAVAPAPEPIRHSSQGGAAGMYLSVVVRDDIRRLALRLAASSTQMEGAALKEDYCCESAPSSSIASSARSHLIVVPSP